MDVLLLEWKLYRYVNIHHYTILHCSFQKKMLGHLVALGGSGVLCGCNAVLLILLRTFLSVGACPSCLHTVVILTRASYCLTRVWPWPSYWPFLQVIFFFKKTDKLWHLLRLSHFLFFLACNWLRIDIRNLNFDLEISTLTLQKQLAALMSVLVCYLVLSKP